VALVKADRRVGLLAAKVDRRSTAQSPVLEPAPAVAATREARCQKHSSIRYDAIQYATFCALKKTTDSQLSLLHKVETEN